MDIEEKVLDAYKKVVSLILDADFYGYDPYDGLNTELPFVSKTTATRMLAVYFNKFSPINFRRLLKVRKSRQLMTMCTTANALAKYCPLERREATLSSLANRIWEDMKKSSLKKKYGYHCWDAHEFPIQMRNRYTHGDVASVVGNQIFGEFLIEYSEFIEGDGVFDTIQELREFFVDRFMARNGDFSFFKYKSEHLPSHITMNASLKAARYLIDAGRYLGCNRYDAEIEAVFRSVVQLQLKDGRWNYNHDFNTGNEKQQVDFHQGYILDDILAYMERFGFVEPFLGAYKKGLQFYREEQFLPSGQSLYRWPRRWPTNIHNQAQGILTFTRASKLDAENFEFANRIAQWTLSNMHDERGFFYYLKYPVFTNKISYIRWNDAAMAYAMAVYLQERSVLGKGVLP